MVKSVTSPQEIADIVSKDSSYINGCNFYEFEIYDYNGQKLFRKADSIDFFLNKIDLSQINLGIVDGEYKLDGDNSYGHAPANNQDTLTDLSFYKRTSRGKLDCEYISEIRVSIDPLKSAPKSKIHKEVLVLRRGYATKN